MGKLIRGILIIALVLIIVYYSIIAIVGITVINNVTSDERPAIEQLGSGLKNIKNQFNNGYNDNQNDTINLK